MSGTKYAEQFEVDNEIYQLRDAETAAALAEFKAKFPITYKAQVDGSASKAYNESAQSTTLTSRFFEVFNGTNTQINSGITYQWTGFASGTSSTAVISGTDVGTYTGTVTVTYGSNSASSSGTLSIYLPQILFYGTSEDALSVSDIETLLSNSTSDNFQRVTAAAKTVLSSTPIAATMPYVGYIYLAVPSTTSINVDNIQNKKTNSSMNMTLLGTYNDTNNSNYSWNVYRTSTLSKDSQYNIIYA